MKPDLNKIVPGLAEARAAEQAARAIAFLDVPQTLLGIEVRPLSFGALFELANQGNPLVCRLPGTHVMISAFLWRLSPRFCRPGTFRWRLTSRYRSRLFRHVQTLSPLAASEVIGEWVTRQKQDEPPSIEETDKDGNPKPPEDVGYYWLASIIDFFGEVYGWSKEKTLNAPIAELWQLYRANCFRHGVKVPVVMPSDRIMREWVNKMIALKRSKENPGNN